jgi:hypothetical protein
MAIVEIAKIQVRRGDAKATGMPTLDVGEFGWAISGTAAEVNDPELYIGNPDPDVPNDKNNVRILTELDVNLFTNQNVQNSAYTYKGHKGVTPLTGLNGTDVVRTVQDKLDDTQSLADFGITPATTASFTTLGLQRAINELYLNSDKTDVSSRVPLKIPAGVYNITATIYVPPYATIIGEGKDKTIINMIGTAKVLFQFVDQSSTPGSPVTLLNFNSNTSPRFISIKNMTLMYDPSLDPTGVLPLLRADSPSDCIIDDVKFVGAYTVGGVTSYGNFNADHAGIEMRGTGALTGKNLRITNCIFDNINYGIKSNYDVEDTVIDNNRFENLYRGIVYAESLAAGNTVGPKRSRITRNLFSIIAEEAIKHDAVTTATYTNHITSENIFNNVGNMSSRVTPGTGDVGATTATNVINLKTFGNVSNNDYFSRFTEINNTTTSVLFVNPIGGHVSITDQKIRVTTLTSAVATDTMVRFAQADSITNIKIQYHYTTTGISRWGNLYIVVSQGIVADITDDYKFIGSNDGNIVFSAVLDNTLNSSGYPKNALKIVYSGNSTNGSITYQINQYY